MKSYSYNATPLEKKSTLSKELGIELCVKRDDLFSLTGGGNKARKLQYIMANAVEHGYNAVVTAGGAQSNHVRATALMAAQLGWASTMIIHDDAPNEEVLKGNLKLIKLAGANCVFVEHHSVAKAMDDAMDIFRDQGLKPLYIWGGGHSVEGSCAYYDAVREVADQLPKENHPDYIIHASGIGSTQAGIVVGCQAFMPSCKVIGISVARDSKKGTEAVLKSMEELQQYLNMQDIENEVHFDDSFIGAGYESVYPELIDTIKWAAKEEGLILDPTYTGKAFQALKTYTENGRIPKGSKVLFWHTGGLLNLMASEVI